MSAVPGLTLVFVQAVVDLDYTPVVFGLVAHTSQRAALAVQKGWSPCRYVTWEFSFYPVAPPRNKDGQTWIAKNQGIYTLM